MKYRVNWGNLPPDPDGMTFSDCKKDYRMLWSQAQEAKRMKRAADATARERAEQARLSAKDLKKAKGEIVTLTKQEHAKSKEKSSAAYASTAATTLIIFYQVVEVSGGWGKWSPVFEHEATIGCLQVAIGSAFAWAMRPLH